MAGPRPCRRGEPERHAGLFGDLASLQDDELGAITQPVALLIAAKGEPFDPAGLATRAEALIPRVTIEVVPDAGHAPTVSHAHVCVAAIARTPA